MIVIYKVSESNILVNDCLKFLWKMWLLFSIFYSKIDLVC